MNQKNQRNQENNTNSQKLHILEVNKFYPPHVGGIETVIAQRADDLAARPDVELKVLVCQERGKGITEQKSRNFELIRCASAGVFCSCPVSLEFFRKFAALIRWADVIEFHTPFPLGDLACLLSHCQCRVVVSWHSDVIRQKRLLKFYQPILKKFLRRADCIITATEGHIQSSAFLPAFRDKCRIIPYPVKIPDYETIEYKPVLRKKLRNPAHIKLLFVGRFVYYKGIDVLLKAFRQVHNCELFLCGTGILEAELRSLAENLDVHFLGKLSDAELKAAFADCDIFVLPSVQNSEAFGIVQQEAMIYGKPVINTNLPTGVPYVSIHGETGLTVEPEDVQGLADAIQMLADSPKLRKIYGENARKRVCDCYESNRIMQEVYEVLCGNY
ncbi:MAG: glycosyltransferase [Oscillospiraceae bacterium]|nr:glycosyltransferase [Oscillospiraceae bacterium]